MSKIVRDDGFDQDNLSELDFVTLETLRQGVENPVRLALKNDENPDELQPFFCWIEMIRIDDLLAARQPEWLWQSQVMKKNLSYQERLLKAG